LYSGLSKLQNLYFGINNFTNV